MNWTYLMKELFDLDYTCIPIYINILYLFTSPNYIHYKYHFHLVFPFPSPKMIPLSQLVRMGRSKFLHLLGASSAVAFFGASRPSRAAPWWGSFGVEIRDGRRFQNPNGRKTTEATHSACIYIYYIKIYLHMSHTIHNYIHTDICTYKCYIFYINTYFTHIDIPMSHTYIHTYMHPCIHTYIPTYLHTYIRTYLHTCIPAYLHTCTPAHLHTYIRTYVDTYIRTYGHTYIRTYIHTYRRNK